MRDATIFLGESHSIAHVVGATIIGGKGKAKTLSGIGNIIEMHLQLTHITGGGRDIGIRLIKLFARQREMVCRGWHYLHQATGTCP